MRETESKREKKRESKKRRSKRREKREIDIAKVEQEKRTMKGERE